MIKVYIWWLLACVPAVFADDSNVACLVETYVPTFGLAADTGAMSGTVTAYVQVGPGGKPRDIRITGTNHKLSPEIKMYLREAKYDPHCASKTVTMKYTFQLAPGLVGCQIQKVWFRPPNHFIVLTHTSKPIID